MPIPTTYNKHIPREEMSQVCVINKSKTKTFSDMWEGVRYRLRPRTKVYVARYIAKHWLGDPDYLGEKEELARVKNRHGAEVFSLLASGDVYCPQFADQTPAYNSRRQSNVSSVQEGMSLDDDEFGEGSSDPDGVVASVDFVEPETKGKKKK
jgi:hypothetical protein